jgi:signal transduction histidine kinase/CheY-like chemotaxis protein/HPt (histidine-containing phosphotransfer) domain-containing protein
MEIEHLKESFMTLKEGGEITHHIELNLVNKTQYIDKVHYNPTDDFIYSIEAIDLNPKLDQTVEKLDELIVLIERYEEISESGSDEASILIEKELDNFMKYIPPHFLRMKENASRIIYESKIRADAYDEKVLEQKALFLRVEILISFLLTVITLVYGYRTLKQLFDMNTTLQEYAYRAEQANIAKSVFVANMSHEIRTPLNAIIGFSELMNESESLPDKEKEYVDIITRSGRSLLGIINDILDLSKIESDNFDLEYVSFGIQDLFEELIELYNIKAKEQKIMLDYVPDVNMPKYVFGDPVRLRQVVTNLLSNAIKFTESGGSVTLKVFSAMVDDKSVKLKIAVSDTGIGISKENQNRIFRSFEQAERGTTRKYGGTGLGLAISRKIVEAYGSKLTLESTEGKGSEFSFEVILKVDFSSIAENDKSQWNMRFGVCCKETVYPELRERIVHYVSRCGETIDDFATTHYDDLDGIFVFYNDDILQRLRLIKGIYTEVPIIYVGDISKLNSIEASYIGDVIDEPLYGSKVLKMLSRYYYLKKEHDEVATNYRFSGKVIVAEDNKINQHLIDILLMKFGLKAQFADNGEEAIVMYRRENPDLILMDLHMPVLDGVEATVKIQEMIAGGAKKVPIVALTADVLGQSLDDIMAYGFSDYITKPVILEDFEKVLTDYLKRVEIDVEVPEESHHQADENDRETIHYEKVELSRKSARADKEEYDIVHVSRSLALAPEELLFIIDQFYLELNTHFSKLQMNLESGDNQKLKHALHNLKGACGNLRFTRAFKVLTEMESDAESGNTENIDLDYLRQVLMDTKDQIDITMMGE